MRESGILMHITSLPGSYGIGTMGREAYAFVDFLEQAGQSCWQILPLTPTGYGNSPYQSCSSYAGNHYLIDLDTLVEEGLLEKAEIEALQWESEPGRVDFGLMYTNRNKILHTAFARFRPDGSYREFVAENESWLRDYALFMALKDYHGGKPWLDWEKGLKNHEQAALDAVQPQLQEALDYQYFLQYTFAKQWQALRDYAHGKGIRIIGDVPIYVPMDSVEAWSNPELFQLDEERRPIKVAGCPPDGFTADGQLWGNPLYDWPKLAATGYDWYLRRLGAAGKRYDVIRIDHFRGFESYWAVPAGDDTARGGSWMPGPGMDFMNALRKGLPHLDFIAEDLGFITDEVRQLQIDSGYPGMKVIEFAFDAREESDYQPHLYNEDSVCYTGTHDNVTVKQWLEEADPAAVDYARAYLGLNREEGYVWGFIRGGMGSVSRLCVVQMQDYLELGKPGRMNFPGTMTNANWTWRAEKGFASPALAKRIYALTQLYGRLPAEKAE